MHAIEKKMQKSATSKIINPSLGIVILSCDKFMDLWDPVVNEFFYHWSDCPFPVYLISNEKKCEDPRVSMINTGKDIDWSTSVSKGLENFSHSHILFWMDDAFLSNKIDTKRIENIFQYHLENNLNFMRLRSDPKPARKIDNQYRELAKDGAYRVSIFATMWRLEVFQKILVKGESAWEFELNGTLRSRDFDKFYSVNSDCFPHIHGVERGVWIRNAATYLRKRGYEIDSSYRPVMSKLESFFRNYRVLKTWILHLLPEKLRAPALSSIQRIYKILRLR